MMDMQTPPAQGVASRAGRLFDPKSGTNLLNQTIVIQGDRIADARPADRIHIPPGAQVIDLNRATVLPGLIDRHIHLMQDQQSDDGRGEGLLNCLAAGVDMPMPLIVGVTGAEGLDDPS
jgi:imidazolonepropionase-like amidohydrolase